MNVRAPEPDDAPAVLELIVARDVADLGQPDYTLDDLKGDWASPAIDLTLDAWLVEDGDGPLGYALLDDGAAALVTVPPASEGRGVGTVLREAAEQRAAARGERRVSQYVVPTNEAARAHLRDAGYELAYRYLRMRIDLADAPEPPSEIPVRAFVRGEDDRALHELIDAAVADIPGNLPSSFASWQAGKHDDREPGIRRSGSCTRMPTASPASRCATAGTTESASSTTSRSRRGPADAASVARCCCTGWRRCARRA